MINTIRLYDHNFLFAIIMSPNIRMNIWWVMTSTISGLFQFAKHFKLEHVEISGHPFASFQIEKVGLNW